MKNDVIKKLHEGKVISLEDACFIGDTRLAHERFPFRFSYLDKNKLGSGYFCNVYSTNQENPLAVKVINSEEFYYPDRNADGYSLQKLINGLINHRKLRKRVGSSVVKAKGMFNIYNETMEKFVPGLVMERFFGSGFDSKDSKVDILNKKERICNKLKKAGHKTFYWFGGIPDKNILYNKDSGRFGFVDFDLDEVEDCF